MHAADQISIHASWTVLTAAHAARSAGLGGLVWPSGGFEVVTGVRAGFRHPFHGRRLRQRSQYYAANSGLHAWLTRPVELHPPAA